MACLLALASSANAQPAPAPAAPTVPATPPPAETLPPAAAEPAPPPPPPPVYTAPPPPPPLVEPPPPAVLVPAAPPAAAEAPPDPLVATAKFKPGKGLDIKSADGNFALNLRFKGQLQAELFDGGGPADPEATDNTDLRTHFIIRRFRLAAGGNVFSKDIKYKFEFTFARQELSYGSVGVSGLNSDARADAAVGPTTGFVIQQAPQLDAYLEFAQLRDATLRVGQSKVTYGRERVLSDSDLQTVDRSIDDAEFNFDRDMGVELRSTDFLGLDTLRYFIGVYAAEDRNATLTSPGTGDGGFLYFGRVEILPMGSFEDTPVDFARTSPKLSLGLAYAYVTTDAVSPYAATTSLASALPAMGTAKIDYKFSNFTADVLFKAYGFSLFTAFHWRKAADLPEAARPNEDRATSLARDGIGFVVQGHYLLSKSVPLSIAGNFSTIKKVGDDSAMLERSEAGGGIGYYFFDHGLKIEGEFEHIWREDEEAAKPDNRFRLQLSFII